MSIVNGLQTPICILQLQEEEAAAEAERLAKEAQEIKELRQKQQFKVRTLCISPSEQ